MKYGGWRATSLTDSLTNCLLHGLAQACPWLIMKMKKLWERMVEVDQERMGEIRDYAYNDWGSNKRASNDVLDDLVYSALHLTDLLFLSST